MNAETARIRFLDIQERIKSAQMSGFRSPSFLMPSPTIRHRERIPPAARAAMAPAWNQIWHPSRPLRISVLENVFVAQEGLVLFPDGQVVEQSIEQHTPEAIQAARLAVLNANRRNIPTHPGNVVLCRKPGAAVYGHWLVELLPRAWFASQAPQSNSYMLQAVDGRMSTIMRESLAMLGITSEMIVQSTQAPMWVDRLIHVQGLTSHGSYMSPLVIECLRTVSSRIEAGHAKSIFVTRPSGSDRRLADESRIARMARQAGYLVIDPSTLPFAQQVSLFKGARKIIGVMGSALANLVFVQPGAEVYILSPENMPDTFFWFLGNHTGSRMVDIRCRTSPAKGQGVMPWDLTMSLDAKDEDIFEAADPASLPKADCLFDPAFYARAWNRIDASTDLLEHYMTRGWKEGQAPSPCFDGNAYLTAYPDVREAGLNPLLHYLRHGRSEGRMIFSTIEPSLPVQASTG